MTGIVSSFFHSLARGAGIVGQYAERIDRSAARLAVNLHLVGDGLLLADVHRTIAPDAAAAEQQSKHDYQRHAPPVQAKQHHKPADGKAEEHGEEQPQKGRNHPHRRTDHVAERRAHQQKGQQKGQNGDDNVQHVPRCPKYDDGSTTPEGKCCQILLVAFRSHKLLSLCNDTLLADAGSLAGQVAEVVETCATYATLLVNDYALNEWRLHWENALYTDAVRNLANGETLLCTMTRNTDDYASVLLDTLLVTLLDLVGNSDRVAAVECRKLFAGGESLFCNFHQICHNDCLMFLIC
jgi:hypothetical protein